MNRASAIIAASAAAILAAAFALADVVPTVQWDVETGRLVPVPYTLSIRRGESANLQPRFLSYNSAMVLTGSTVQLRYWYTGQTGYYATTGSLMAATGRVHVAWYDALCPASNALNYEVRCTLGTNVLARAYGTLNLLTGTSGTETNGQVRTSINWALVDQTGGPAVLSNQMGSGATWNGSAWAFAGGTPEADTWRSVVDRGNIITNDWSWDSIPTLGAGFVDGPERSLPIRFMNGAMTNNTFIYAQDNRLRRGTISQEFLENPLWPPYVGMEGDFLMYDSGTFVAGTHYLAPNGSASGMSGCPSGAVPNTPAGIAAAGGLTNRAFVTATALNCSPTTTITRAMIDAAPWGEMTLSLTQACYLTFDATVTGSVDVATFAIYLSGTNTLTWNTNQLTGTAWTNATSGGSDRLFRKPARAGTVAIW